MLFDREFQNRVFPWIIGIVILWMAYAFMVEPLTRGMSWLNPKQGAVVSSMADRPIPEPLRTIYQLWSITPCVQGLSLAEAKEIAKKDGLLVEVMTVVGEPLGEKIRKQFPLAGEEIQRGSTIRVILGLSPAELVAEE